MVNKFLKYQNQEASQNHVIDGIDFQNAKACAIICVKEIINEYQIWAEDLSVAKSRDKWIEVKEELEKL